MENKTTSTNNTVAVVAGVIAVIVVARTIQTALALRAFRKTAESFQETVMSPAFTLN